MWAQKKPNPDTYMPITCHLKTTSFFPVSFFPSFLSLCWVLVAACGIFSCSIWGLVPWPGIEPGSPMLGMWSLSHWTPSGRSNNFWFMRYKAVTRFLASEFPGEPSYSIGVLWEQFARIPTSKDWVHKQVAFELPLGVLRCTEPAGYTL